MAEEERGDRTEEATPRRREEARKQGNIARSTDLTSAVGMAAALIALGYFGSNLSSALLSAMRILLSGLDGQKDMMQVLAEHGPAALWPLCSALFALFGCVLVAGLALGIAQAGIHVNFEILEPKLERLNPIDGFSRIFSLTSVVTAGLGLLKLLVASWAAYSLLKALIGSAPAFWQSPIEGLLPLCSENALSLGWSIAIPMLAIGAVDYAYKRWKHEKDLRMSKQEIIEENKQLEGDPKIKMRIRQIQREVATRRMMQEVPNATVVITNPTHVAVALRYEPGSAAPVVLAKGEHKMAERIKAMAREHGVPVIEEPPLARALLRVVKIGQWDPLESTCRHASLSIL